MTTTTTAGTTAGTTVDIEAVDIEAVARAAYERRFPGCWEAIGLQQADEIAKVRGVVEALADQGLVILSDEDAARGLAFMRSCKGWWNSADQETADRIAAALAAPGPAQTEG